MAHLQEAAVKQITEICDRYKNENTPLMMILSDIQKEYGYIPLEVQELVSEKTGISVAEIYGVVTFYSFFSLKPKGKNVVGCCLGTACYVKGAQQIIDKFSEILGIKPGETSDDGLFTLDALRCIGACGIAPACQINGTVYPKMTVDKVPQLIEQYKKYFIINNSIEEKLYALKGLCFAKEYLGMKVGDNIKDHNIKFKTTNYYYEDYYEDGIIKRIDLYHNKIEILLNTGFVHYFNLYSYEKY